VADPQGRLSALDVPQAQLLKASPVRVVASVVPGRPLTALPGRVGGPVPWAGILIALGIAMILGALLLYIRAGRSSDES